MINFKISVVTPAHKYTSYLTELYESINSQSYANWEWILLLNGELKVENLPLEITSDERVKIFTDYSGNSNIGFLKNLAFSLAGGEILAEVDYDDLITKDCLQEVNLAFQNREVGFVYSDNAILPMSGNFVPYNKAYGWTHRKFEWKGENLISMNTFLPSSHSLSFIYYAPDHIRVWRRDVYEKLGGHNVNLAVCDDHDLLARTYLETEFLKIDKVLYIYRKTAENTTISRNSEIQRITREIFRKYALSLAHFDSNARGLISLDFAKIEEKLPGFKSVRELEQFEQVFDIGHIPLPDNSVGVLNISHQLQKIFNKSKIMEEIHRVLAHGAWVFIEVPSTDGRGAFQDPTHVSYWNENSFLYYTHAKFSSLIDNSSIKFSSFLLETANWERDVKVTRAFMCALKEPSKRFPGLVEI
jgi:glycosyltransferase involved in cell wall biosynthesis